MNDLHQQNSQHSLSKNNYVLFGALGSFSMMTGIKVEYSINFTNNSDNTSDSSNKSAQKTLDFSNFPIINFFRTILTNVHRQNEQYLKNFPTSILNDNYSKTKVISSSFKYGSGMNKAFYSFAFFIYQQDPMTHPILNDLLKEHTEHCARKIHHNLMNQQSSLQHVSSFIETHGNEINELISSGIQSIHSIINCFNSGSDLEFFSNVLDCHIFTQMTTILVLDEGQTGEDCPLFHLLTAFMFPFQLQLTDPKPRDNPVPGLFLQCLKPLKGLKKRTTIPIRYLLQFKRPFTCVFVQEREIIYTFNIPDHQKAYSMYKQSVLLNFDQPTEDVIRTIENMEPMKTIVHKDPSPFAWSIGFLKELQNIPDHLRITFCREKLNEMSQKAVLLIQATDASLTQGKGLFLTPNKFREICQTIRISETEKDLILSIAYLFDTKILDRTERLRTEMLQKLASTL